MAKESTSLDIEGFRLPTEAVDITPEFLSRAISVMHPGTTVESFEVVDAQGVGGMVSTAGRAQLKLKYSKGSPKLPERVVSKMILGQKSIAPPCMFETEVQMYRKMLPDVKIFQPKCLAAFFERETGNFMLLLEDLNTYGATFTNVLLPPLTPDAVGACLDTLAVLHAHYWESPRLDEEKSWLSTLTRGPGFDTFDNGFIVPVTEMSLAEQPWRRDVLTRTGVDSAQKLWELTKAVHRHQEKTIPQTLCHGDTGAHNTFHLPDGRGGFLDYQFSSKASWSHDVSYLIVTALSVKDRREHEKKLVERYLKALRAQGVNYEPSIAQAFDDYSLAIIWGFQFGWFAVPPSFYGMEIIMANVERLFCACQDHNVFRRAEKLP